MQRLVTEQMCRAMTGRGPGPRFHDAVVFAETLIGAGVAGTWPSILLRRPGYLAAKARVVALMRQIVAERRAHHASGARPANEAPDLLDAILTARNEDGTPLTEVELVVGAGRVFVFAGFLLFGTLICDRSRIEESCSCFCDQVRSPSIGDLVVERERQRLKLRFATRTLWHKYHRTMGSLNA